MQISFDTERDTAVSARALLAVMVTLYPEIMDESAAAAADNGYSHVRPATTEQVMAGLYASPIEADDDAAPTGAPIPAGATDVSGLPWDERIHSANRATNADGTWRKRRNVDDATIATVTAELRGGAAPVPTPAPSAPSVPAPAPSSAPMPPVPAAAPVPSPIAIQAENSAPAPAPVPPAGGEQPDMEEFARIMKKVAEYQATGKVTGQQVNETLAQCGMTSPRDLVTSSMGRMTFEAMIDTLASA